MPKLKKLRQVEETRAARERQKLMVENIIQQRDMYKSMASGPAAAATPAAMVKPGEGVKDAGMVKELGEVKKDFADYKMLNDQVEKMRSELTEARTKAAKLGSQEVGAADKRCCVYWLVMG